MTLENFTERTSEVLGHRLFEIGGSDITVGHLIAFCIVIVVTLVFAKFVERRISKALSRHHPDREGSAGATARLVYYLLLVIGLATALNILGIHPSALFAAGAIFAVGLGFGLQNVVQNFVSGVILLGERSIKPGDILELDTEMVRVERMGLRSTIARTLDEEQYLVPNEQLVQSRVKNYTLNDRIYRLRLSVGVAYSSDLPAVFQVLEQAAITQSRLKSKPPKVLFTGFGSSSIDFEVSIWIGDPWQRRQRVSDLGLAIWRHLKDADIVIAFPQLDIHADGELVEALLQRRHRVKEPTIAHLADQGETEGDDAP